MSKMINAKFQNAGVEISITGAEQNVRSYLTIFNAANATITSVSGPVSVIVKDSHNQDVELIVDASVADLAKRLTVTEMVSANTNDILYIATKIDGVAINKSSLSVKTQSIPGILYGAGYVKQRRKTGYSGQYYALDAWQ